MAEKSLLDYLRGRFPKEDVAPITVRKFEHGQSNPTYYIRLGARELVLRKKPVIRNAVRLEKLLYWNILLFDLIENNFTKRVDNFCRRRT